MSIEKLLSRAFPAHIRLRGRAYAEGGLVRLAAVSENEAEFRISGASQYKVHIKFKPELKEVRLDCDCPFAFGGDPCKHLWASVLVSDRKKILPQLAAGEVIDVAFGPDVAEQDEESINRE